MISGLNSDNSRVLILCFQWRCRTSGLAQRVKGRSWQYKSLYIEARCSKLHLFSFFVLIKKLHRETPGYVDYCVSRFRTNRYFNHQWKLRMRKTKRKAEHSNCLWTHHGWVKTCILLLWLPSWVWLHHPVTFRNSWVDLSFNWTQQKCVHQSLSPGLLQSMVGPWRTSGELWPTSNPKNGSKRIL